MMDIMKSISMAFGYTGQNDEGSRQAAIVRVGTSKAIAKHTFSSEEKIQLSARTSPLPASEPSQQ
jgi:hypothetical protein